MFKTVLNTESGLSSFMFRVFYAGKVGGGGTLSLAKSLLISGSISGIKNSCMLTRMHFASCINTYYRWKHWN